VKTRSPAVAKVGADGTGFKIIQGQSFICHLKASMRLAISDQ